MKAYLISTGAVFGLITAAHVWRVAEEGGHLLTQPFFAIMTVAVAGLAQMVAISTRSNVGARATTYASLLAQQKMEQLRSLTWGFDAVGLPVTDTTSDIAVVPESPSGGRGLSPSPGSSLDESIDGYCDFIDTFGRPLGGGTVPPAGTAYVRRWSIEPLPGNPDNTIVLQVLVMRWGSRNAAAGLSTRGRSTGLSPIGYRALRLSLR